MESQFYHINLLQLLLKWKLHLAIIMVLAILSAAFFSGPAFITPKYKSFAIVYPANISSYSDENETEQMLQILQSKDISDSIIARFNLPAHYEIDKNYVHYYTTMMDEYWQNVHVSKTPYEGVSIEVRDKDANMACNMVNVMIDLYNLKVRNMHEEKFGEVVRMYSRALQKKKDYIDSLDSRITYLGQEYGLTDYEAQAEQVTKGFLKTVDGTGSDRIRDAEVNKLKTNIEAKGAEMQILQNLIIQESIKYTDLKNDYEKAYMDYDRRFTYTNVITSPYPADKKSYPVRWLIVVLAAVASFFISFIVILLLENFKGMIGKKS